MKAVWGAKSGFFTSTEKSILVRLADFAADDGSSIYPSVKRISAETEFAERCINYTIPSLLKKGVLELVKTFKGRRPNVYQINVSFLNKLNEENDFIDEYDTNYAASNPAPDASNPAPRAPHPSITIIEPSLSCENGGNFDDPEARRVSSSKIDLELETKNDRSPDYSHPISVAIAPSVFLEEINFEEGIQNTPPGGFDPVIGQKSSEGLLKEDFEESCGDELSNGLEADRIRASRGDYIHAQAPLEDPSETNTPKTCHFSASEALPLRDHQR